MILLTFARAPGVPVRRAVRKIRHHVLVVAIDMDRVLIGIASHAKGARQFRKILPRPGGIEVAVRNHNIFGIRRAKVVRERF